MLKTQTSCSKMENLHTRMQKHHASKYRRHAQNRLYAQKLMEKLRTQMQKHAQNAKTSCSNHRHHAQNTDVMPKIDLLKIQSCHAESTETMLKISLVPRLSPRQKLHTVKKDLLF